MRLSMFKTLCKRAAVLASLLLPPHMIAQAQDLAITNATVYSAPDGEAQKTFRF
jgi:hypothetical protein